MRLPARLLVISDRLSASRPLDEVVAECLRGGCRWLSLREKDLPRDEQIALFAPIVALARQAGATVTVHGDPDVALAVGADGVHLPAGGLVPDARTRLGESALIGLSVHQAKEAANVDPAVDYVTLSPVFASASKPGYGPALGPSGLAHGVAGARAAVVALGGITAGNVQSCLAAGAAAVAVMGAVMAAADPAAASRTLLRAITR